MGALELRQVSKSYGDGAALVDALRNVDLTVNAGELVAIMGPSGSGKSTLLTIAGTLEDGTSGDVFVDGHEVSTMSRNERARLRRRSIGYVFQDFNLLAGLTAAENVSLPLELDGIRARTARAVAMGALEELGLADRAGRYPDELSGGERQRVAIARAVVGDRRLLLADEPTGALDSVNGEGVMRLVRTACKRGVAGVVVTHDAQLASWADRVVFLRDGRVVDQTATVPGPESLLATGAERDERCCRASAVVRWAWRLFRREWRQQILVLTLLTVAVGAAVGLAAAAYNIAPVEGEAEFGTATSFFRFDEPQPEALQAKLEAGEEWFGAIDVIGHRSVSVPGSIETVDYRTQDPQGPFGTPMLDLRRRSVPTGGRRDRRDRRGGRDVRPRTSVPCSPSTAWTGPSSALSRTRAASTTNSRSSSRRSSPRRTPC